MYRAHCAVVFAIIQLSRVGSYQAHLSCEEELYLKRTVILGISPPPPSHPSHSLAYIVVILNTLLLSK